MTARHIPVLDGIRGLAVGLVMAHHFLLTFVPQGNPLDAAVSFVAKAGWAGVDLFFVLSGFLITGILYDTRKREHYWRNFYARRTLRIFPLYYVVLALLYLVLPHLPYAEVQEYVGAAADDQVWYWTYLTNVKLALKARFYDHLLPNVLWSLAVEEQFYLVWPFVVLFCGRRALLSICVGLIVGAPLLRFALLEAGFDPIAGYVLTPTRMDSLAAGALLALAVRGPGGLERWARPARWAALASAAGLGVIAARHAGLLKYQYADVNVLGFSLLAVLFGALVVHCLTCGQRGLVYRALDNTPMRLLGKYSYALYLCHGPAKTVASLVVDDEVAPALGSGLPRMLPFLALASALSLLIAWLSWNLLEKRILRLKDRFQ